MSPVKYELGLYITEDDILHSHRRENLKSYKLWTEQPRKRSSISSVRIKLCRRHNVQCD
jgi:hypothetical protein